jgi:hypothetical protein
MSGNSPTAFGEKSNSNHKTSQTTRHQSQTDKLKPSKTRDEQAAYLLLEPRHESLATRANSPPNPNPTAEFRRARGNLEFEVERGSGRRDSPRGLESGKAERIRLVAASKGFSACQEGFGGQSEDEEMRP